MLTSSARAIAARGFVVARQRLQPFPSDKGARRRRTGSPGRTSSVPSGHWLDGALSQRKASRFVRGPSRSRGRGFRASLRRVRATLAALQCGGAEPVTGDVEVGGESATASVVAGSLVIGWNAGASSTSRVTGAFPPARGSATFRVKSAEGAGRCSFVNVLGLGSRLQKSKGGRFTLG